MGKKRVVLLFLASPKKNQVEVFSGNECSICADDNVVQVIAYRQLLTQGRLVELLFVLGERDWHSYSSLKYPVLISRSLDTAQ